MAEVECCIYCERTGDEVPLVVLTYQGKNYWICAEHLPILIHKPAQLAEKLPGAALMTGHSHDHD